MDEISVFKNKSASSDCRKAFLQLIRVEEMTFELIDESGQAFVRYSSDCMVNVGDSVVWKDGSRYRVASVSHEIIFHSNLTDSKKDVEDIYKFQVERTVKL